MPCALGATLGGALRLSEEREKIMFGTVSEAGGWIGEEKQPLKMNQRSQRFLHCPPEPQTFLYMYTTAFLRASQQRVKVGFSAAPATWLGHRSLLTPWACGIRGPPHAGLPQAEKGFDVTFHRHSATCQNTLPTPGPEQSAWSLRPFARCACSSAHWVGCVGAWLKEEPSIPIP